MAYISLKKNNLKVYGIGRFKTLSEFCTSERDVKKGQNRRPLALARLHEEDLMSDEDVQKALKEKKQAKDEEMKTGELRPQNPKATLLGQGTSNASVSGSDLSLLSSTNVLADDSQSMMKQNLEHRHKAAARHYSLADDPKDEKDDMDDDVPLRANTKSEVLYNCPAE